MKRAPNQIEQIEKRTRDELISSLFNEKDSGADFSNEELIEKFAETYRDGAELMTKAAQGNPKAVRWLRWVCALMLIS